MSRAPRKPAKLPSAAAEVRRGNVLIEKLTGEFRVFGESLSAVRERVERLEPTVNQLANEFQTFKIALFEVSKNGKKNTEDVSAIKADVTTIKGNITTINGDITTIKGDLAAVRKNVEHNTASIEKNTAHIKIISTDIAEIKERLSTAESKLSA